jgi:hypothetical protein
MPRHESVSDEYVAELRAGFLAEAEWVRSASDWPETQRRMVMGTYPYLVALGRVDERWSREQISRELEIRRAFRDAPNRVRVIGG